MSVTGYINKLDNMITLVNVSEGEIPAGVTTAYQGDGSMKVQARMYKNMDDARTCMPGPVAWMSRCLIR